MLIFIEGGAASGKSEFAETAALSFPPPYCYLATMEPHGAEAAAKIFRHRSLRAGKGFATMEIPRFCSTSGLPTGKTVLLECLSTLAANTLFLSDGSFSATAEEEIWAGLTYLEQTNRHLVIVSNALFADGQHYDAGTTAYLALLAHLHRRIAAIADTVVEVVCGLPLCHKGTLPTGLTKEVCRCGC